MKLGFAVQPSKLAIGKPQLARLMGCYGAYVGREQIDRLHSTLVEE